ncbi:MAG: endonuclease/exonuclease/phosphatase family protein [Lysinibacillus sp.]
MEDVKYTFLEWNIQGFGGSCNYSIPNFVIDTVIYKNADIVVLVEFYIGNNFDYVREKMKGKYHIFISPFVYGHNQVLIALKKTRFKDEEIKEVISINPVDTALPEYLQINIVTERDEEFSVVGTRIKTQGDKREEQFNYLKERLKLIETFVCLGDFNMFVGSVDKKFPEIDEKSGTKKKAIVAYGPRTTNKERWSFIHRDGGKAWIDAVVGKNIKVLDNQTDALSKKKGYMMYAKYDWDFVNQENGYRDISPDDYISLKGIPNHAILLGAFTLEDE